MFMPRGFSGHQVRVLISEVLVYVFFKQCSSTSNFRFCLPCYREQTAQIERLRTRPGNHGVLARQSRTDIILRKRRVGFGGVAE
jgi:hypothetical protein